MHLADGILTDPRLVVGLDLVGGGALAVAIRKMDSGGARHAAWTGLFGAFVLSAQAVNVPLLLGTSAHVIGTGLVTLALGPARAIVTLSAVLLAQALLLGDGGLTVLGVNILTLAVIPALSVNFAAGVFGRQGAGLARAAVIGTTLGNAAGASVLAAALVANLEVRAATTFGWLVGIQTLAGLGEGVLTALAVRDLERRATGLLHRDAPAGPHRSPTRALVAWSLILVGATTAAIPLGSGAEDALERLLSEAPRSP